MKRVLSAVGPLVSAVGAVLLGRLYIENGWARPALLVFIVVVLVGASYLAGSANLRNHPHVGSWMMESGYGLLLLGAAVAGAVLFWLAVQKAPGKDAAELTKQTYTGLVGALAAFLGSIVIKLDMPWDAVKKAIKSTFSTDFTQGRDDVEKDAADAVALDNFGARHPGEAVAGWAWSARRLRARQIQRAVKAGYLDPQ